MAAFNDRTHYERMQPESVVMGGNDRNSSRFMKALAWKWSIKGRKEHLPTSIPTLLNLPKQHQEKQFLPRWLTAGGIKDLKQGVLVDEMTTVAQYLRPPITPCLHRDSPTLGFTGFLCRVLCVGVRIPARAVTGVVTMLNHRQILWVNIWLLSARLTKTLSDTDMPAQTSTRETRVTFYNSILNF